MTAPARLHEAHTEEDRCPVCGLPWTQWPMAHLGDAFCGQYCEKRAGSEVVEPAPEQPFPAVTAPGTVDE